MKAPAFWNVTPPSLPARLLAPLGAVYGAIALRRMRAPRADCGVPVICVGNYTAGGAGKTPLAAHVAELLLARGERVFFLSRGYRGRLSGVTPLRVDRERHTAAEVGDEPLLLARAAPVIIGADRLAAARLARRQGASAIVMDDGLQSGGLRHALTLCAIDAGAGFGNGLCVPAGPLRAPLAGQRACVSAEIVIGDGPPLPPAAMPRFAASLRLDAVAVVALQGRRLLAFAGIGRPEKFFASLASVGADVARRRAFADHHAFADHELAALASEAARDGLLLTTTEKDAVRLPQDWLQRHDVRVVAVTLHIEDAAAFAALVLHAVSPASGQS